jgi:selenocysteine lyase/cysteine desulfurase
MKIDRREFLSGTLAVGAGAAVAKAAAAAPPSELATWEGVRAEFPLSREYTHLALLLLASHPRPVREAIERHRRGFDENPAGYFHANVERCEREIREAAAVYVGGKPDEVAVTGNTTTGLALLYSGMALRPGQEIVTTTHDHYVTHEALRLRAAHTGATVRKVPLYAVPERTSEDEVVSNLTRAIGPRTRAVAVTWVHSSTGVKLPIKKMAAALADLNRKRDEHDRVLLCVDGVHGFGVEAEAASELGCDFFVAGCHKWMFGPRGTGIVWGRAEAWRGHSGIIPCFEWGAFELWMRGLPPDSLPPGPRVTPGGFQSFEHRWALPEAFRFHQRLGRARVAARVHELARRCKEGLAAIPRVKLHTPASDGLSAALVCFEVADVPPKTVVERLAARKIIASDTPYATSYARLTPSILNTPEEIDRTVAELKTIAG